MSNPENVAAITALLTADDIMAASDKIKQLQTFLEFEGHTANSSKYPADGKIGKLTGKDIVDFLKDNPSVLAQTDPSLIERLVDKGYRDDLVTIAQRNPDVRDTLRTRAGEILDGQTPKTINGTQKLRDIQSLLAATGDYTASIDAKTGPATRGALAKANLTTGAAAAFDRAVPLATVTRNTSLALQAVTINQDDYMEALGFTKQGLGLGDGGRAQQHEEAVTNLQVLLRRAGVNVGVDGDYGSQTQAAVKKFQETHGLNPTGTADHETLLKLTSLPSTQYDPRPKADPHNYTVLEHRMIRVAITPDVEAATGTSAEYLNAVWKIESTGSLTLGGGRWSRGPDQFIEGTFTGLAQEYGPAIAQQLSARYGGHPAAALLSAGSSNLDMRYDPYVSAFAAGYYTQESGFDTSNRANYKFAYGAHNQGSGGLSNIRNNTRVLTGSNYVEVFGRPAKNNPSYFRGETSNAGILGNFQTKVEAGIASFQRDIVPQVTAFGSLLSAAKPDGGPVFADTSALNASAQPAQVQASPVFPASDAPAPQKFGAAASGQSTPPPEIPDPQAPIRLLPGQILHFDGSVSGGPN